MKKPSIDFPVPEIWHPHRVSYGETDAMGVVYYANYLHWFEISRSAYIRQQGISYARIEENGIYLPVTEATCRYYRPARFDDLVYIRAGISSWGRASFVFEYEIVSEDKTLVMAKGRTSHACVNYQGRPVGVPGWLREMCSVQP